MNWGLRKFDTIKIAKKDEIITSLNVWLGKKSKVEVIPSEDIYMTIPIRRKKTIKAVFEYEGLNPSGLPARLSVSGCW